VTGSRILVAFASKHGSTREVAQAIARTLHELGQRVDCVPASSAREVTQYDGVVIGGALYTGRWHRDAMRLCKEHGRDIAARPWAAFAMGPKTLEDQDVVSSRAQLDAALAKLALRPPDLVAVFGGVVDPAKLRFPFNRMQASDARDWPAIHAWAREANALFRQHAPFEPALR
jgi:menaquinone-dependent protoporphyrinogen oxidase